TYNVLAKMIINCTTSYTTYVKKLDPYIDRDNRIYYKITLNQLKSLLYNCNGRIDQIDGLANKLQLNDLIIYMPSMGQTGGAKTMTPEEFGEKIQILDDGFVLPNGIRYVN